MNNFTIQRFPIKHMQLINTFHLTATIRYETKNGLINEKQKNYDAGH